MKFYIEAVYGEWELIDEMLDQEYEADIELRGCSLSRVINIETIDGFVELHSRLAAIYEYSNSPYHGIILENDRHRDNKYQTLMIYDGYME